METKKYKVLFQVKMAGGVHSIFKEMDLIPHMAHHAILKGDDNWARMQFPGCEWAKFVSIKQIDDKERRSNSRDYSSDDDSYSEKTTTSRSKSVNSEKRSVGCGLIFLPFKILLYIIYFPIWILKPPSMSSNRYDRWYSKWVGWIPKLWDYWFKSL